MSIIKELQIPSTDVPSTLVIETRTPQPVPFGNESLEFHATRLLFLLHYVGGKKGRIVGRTKIAKLDFFVRYPIYLVKAAKKEGITTNISIEGSAESPMIRYKYGPWDHKYYNVFALLVARGLAIIEPSEKGDIFQITERGKLVVEELIGPDFEEIVQRCEVVSKLFGSQKGSYIKDYIYSNFPEVVAKPLGEEIIQ